MPATFAVGSPGSASIANGGKVYPFNNIGNVTPTSLVTNNGARASITFHNPGANDILVYPTTTATGAANVPTIALPGGGYRVYANGGQTTITGECQQAWAALSFAGVNQPLTVSESNVG